MSRVAVFETLATSPELAEFGITRERIFPNWSREERPVPTGPWIILRWGGISNTLWQTVKEPQRLMIWVHIPIEITNDFSLVENILDACDTTLARMWDVEGEDGYTVTGVRIGGRSNDFKDNGFQSITKNGSYEVLYRIGKGSVFAPEPPEPPIPPEPPPEPQVVDGQRWWHGIGPPETIINSRPGDYYIDMETGLLYQLGG